VEVATASDGMEAVSSAAGQNYDLILMDCQMPVMDGFEATRQIRRIEERGRKHTPIVALTASVLPQDREKCFAAGMDEFLTKPVSLDDIRSLIKRWMTEQKQPVKQFINMTNDEVAICDLIHSARFQVSELDQLTVMPREVTKADLQEDFAPTPVDMEWLDEQYGREALSEILQTFTDEAESLMTALKRAALAHDFSESARVAHQLAGIASVIGARQMHAQSLNLEHASKETDTYRANVALDELQRAYEDVVQWITNKK
jgi:CheY-like chemotaxis protein/HPt (histidine-containing phosphotransfer) domain-containing protein